MKWFGNSRLGSVFSFILNVSLVLILIFLMIPPATQPLFASSPSSSSLDIAQPVTYYVPSYSDHYTFYEPKAQPEPIVSSFSVKPDEDAKITSDTGNVSLLIPKGAVSEEMDIEITEHPSLTSTGMVFLRLIEFNAFSASSEKEITNFQKGIEVTINFSALELAGVNLDSLKLCYFDEKGKTWVPVTTAKYDKKQMTLTATLDHFSEYSVQANPLESGPGRVMAAQVGLHSGSAAYSYPITLPVGPGGFQPKLTLSYSSASIDEMKSKTDVGSWVGIGWTLSLGSISHDNSSDRYYLNINGVSCELVSLDGVNYLTSPDKSYKIVRDENTWEMWDRDGTYYRFGGTTDSEQYLYEDEGGYYRWDLSLMRDTNNNEATVSYVQDRVWGEAGIPPVGMGWVRSAYPEYLSYGDAVVHFISSWDDGQLRLRDDNPIDYGSNPAPKVMENRKLDSIEILYDDELISKYNFAYNTTDRVFSENYGGIYYSGKHTLVSITEMGVDGVSQLPSLTFTYEDKQIYHHTSEDVYSGNPGNPASLWHPYLTEIDSGYGGTVSFEYTQTPGTDSWDIWTRELVTTMTTDSGIGSIEVYTYEYHDGPVYGDGASWNAEFKGFGQVIVTDAEGNFTVHYYYTTGFVSGVSTDELSGQEYMTENYNSSEILLCRNTYDWSWDITQPAGNVVDSWSDGVGSQGIAVSADGEYIFAVDTANSRVLKYSSDGTLLLYIGGTNYLTQPLDVAVWGGYVYVTDYAPPGEGGVPHSGIFVFNYNGTLVGSMGYSDGLDQPQGIAVSPDGEYIYVADTNNDRVVVYDREAWSLESTWTAGSLDSPQGIAVSPSGEYIYVADTGNNRIVKYDNDGSVVGQWGTNPQLSQPQGVCVSTNGRVYVADTGNNLIRMYDADGNLITQWGTDPQLSQPQDIAVSIKNYAYVADTGNSVVRKCTAYYIWKDQLDQYEETIGTKTSRTRYEYNEYGNNITIYQDGDIFTTADDVTIHYVYYPNLTANILSQPARERVYATITDDVGGANLKKETLYYYDGNAYYTDSPIKGNLTRSDSRVDASSYVSNYFTYDSFGNMLTSQDPSGNVTSWTYESTYNTYIDSITYSVTGLSESYVYESGTGSMLSKTDLNGQTITYYYDTFKRLIKVVQPGDTEQSPTIEYQYNNWGSLCQQHIKTITKTAVGEYLWQSQYFDGLGRVVQTHTLGEDGSVIVSTVTYNNRGQVDKEYVPQEVSGSGGSTQTGTINTQVAASADDAREFGGGVYFSTTTTWNSMDSYTNPDSGYYRGSGARFQSIEIPQGATITAAWVEIYFYDMAADDADFKIYAEDVNDAVAFADAAGQRVLDRTATTAYASWVEDGVASGGAGWYGSNIDISSVIQEIINRAGWVSGNDLALLFLPYTDEHNLAMSYSFDQGGGYGIKLHIEYEYEDTGGQSGSTDSQIATGADDARRYGMEAWSNTSTINLYGFPEGSETWLRFDGLTLPSGATITSAYIEICANYAGSDAATAPLIIVGIKATDVGSFTSEAFCDALPYTTAYVQDSQSAWTLNSWYQSADLSSIVQEILDYTGGLDDEAMGFYLVDNSGSTMKRFYSYDHSTTLCAKLYIEYEVSGTAPVSGYQSPEAGWECTSYTYDGMGRTISIVNADDTIVSYDYSTAWQTLVTDTRGYKTRYFYDAFGRMEKVQDLDASHQVYATTEYIYDALGNLVQVEDNDSNTTTITYDMLSRRTAMTDPDMGSWMYAYDNNGNLTSQTDAKSQTITSTYDAMNRITGKIYPQGSGMTDATYTYDSTAGGNYGKGLLTNTSDAVGTIAYTYDSRGRLIEEKETIDSVNYVTQYTYDNAGRGLTITYPTGEVVTQEYTESGAFYSLSGSVAGDIVTSAFYNHLGMMTKINLGNGLVTTYGYYGLGGQYDTTGGYYGQLWEIKTADQTGNPVLQDVKYTWDAAGNLVQRENVLASETESFTYDFLDRLTEASGAYSTSYAYDEIGNVTSMNNNSYTYGSQPHAVTSVGATSYTYDANGNMTVRSSQTITWNAANQVTSITTGGNTTTFVYDANGARGKKTEGGETILYVNQFYEKNLTTGVVTTSYYLGASLIATREGTELTYIHKDSLGSTSLVTDDDGDFVSGIKYYPYGATRAGSVPLDKQFTGQELDSTGLYYYGARYYDPAIGRFISADLIIPDPNNPQSFNRYSYCINNPLKYTDPSGRDYIIVAGSGSTEDDYIEWIKYLWKNGLLEMGEQVRIVWDIDPENLMVDKADIDPRLANLLDQINNDASFSTLTDIKIIGFSEGAATLAQFLAELVEDPGIVDSRFLEELTAAILIECPTGASDIWVNGWDDSVMEGLPQALHNVEGLEDLIVADIWNAASIVHNGGVKAGWEDYSFSYCSIPWYAWFFRPAFVYNLWPGVSHSHPLTEPRVWNYIGGILGY